MGKGQDVTDPEVPPAPRRVPTPRVSGWLAGCLALLLAGCAGAAGQDGPPIPYTFQGACPFECCTYGEWTAERGIPVYGTRDTAGPARARLDSGAVFRAVTGRVIVREPARITVREPHELVQYDSAQSVRDPEPRFRATARPGEPVHALSYRGEGVWNVWYRGEVYQTRGLARAFDELQGIQPAEEAGAVLEARPVTEWWVRVRTGTGETGWIAMEEAEVSGADPCAVSG